MGRLKTVLGFILLVVVALAGCQGTDSEETISEGSKWKLVSFGPVGEEKPLIPQTNITLEFGESNKFSGSGGCNRYFGSYEIGEGKSISIGTIGRTEMWCEGKMDQETSYFNALQNVTSFEVTQDQLKLYYNQGKSVLNFVPLESSN